MAKVGPSDEGQYDPFNTISASLASLAETTPAEEAKAPPAHGQDQPPGAATATPREELAPVVTAPTPPPPRASEQGGRTESSTPSPAPRTVSDASALQTTKRFKTTRGEAAELDAASVRLGAALGTTIDFSKVTRALWDVYLRHQDDILRNVPEGEVWLRPANKDAVALAELDQRLANLINEGLMVACRRPNNR